MKLLIVAGARPNFMKVSPIIRAMDGDRCFEWRLVHTGQHYDYEMSESFFKELELPEPDHFLNAGSGSHAEQTAAIMVAFERVCQQEKPDLVLVVGDVNSTLACSVVAKKLNIAVAHVEAGLRSFDMTMPEEINRVVTDSISDLFFVTEESAIRNLIREGKPEDRIHFVGHVMVDNLLYQLEKVRNIPDESFQYSGLKQRLGSYAFLTLHRPSNVDDRNALDRVMQAINEIAKDIPIIFPVHPRTRKRLDEFQIKPGRNVYCLPPISFRESLYLWKDALFVLTDSGGLQEETTALGVPCLTLRKNTERPITCELGSNQLVGTQPERIIAAARACLEGQGRRKGTVPPLWDGKAAERIVEVLRRW